MSQRLVIDCPSFAREAKSLQGDLPIASLTRTLDLLADSAGVIGYRIEGRMGERHRPQLILWIEGVLSLSCQRCLGGITYPLRLENTLEFVVDEEDLTQEEIEDDSKDFLPAEKALDVVALIEDEIILNLPTAPRHEACVLPEAGVQAEKVSPFAVLQSLRNRVH